MKRVFKEAGGVFNIDIKRNVHKVSIYCVVIFLLLSVAVMQMGIFEYSDIERKEFLKINIKSQEDKS